MDRDRQRLQLHALLRGETPKPLRPLGECKAAHAGGILIRFKEKGGKEKRNAGKMTFLQVVSDLCVAPLDR